MGLTDSGVLFSGSTIVGSNRKAEKGENGNKFFGRDYLIFQHLRDVLDRYVFFPRKTDDNIKKLHVEADKEPT